MENTIQMSVQIPEGEGTVDIEYYDLSNPELHLAMCLGDLYKIANVLWDYENILRATKSIFPDLETTLIQDIYADQLHKIREKIEKALDYNVENAHVKCVRKNLKKEKDEGIGEEAMVLAVRKAAEIRAEKDKELLNKFPEKSIKKPTKKKEEIKGEMEGQTNLLDLINDG